MISMSFDKYDKIEENVINLQGEIDLADNLSLADLERLFIAFPKPDAKTGYAPDVVPFLIYLKDKLEQEDSESFYPTVKNIDTILRKYLILED